MSQPPETLLNMQRSVQQTLEREPIRVWAPCRIDMGSGWDLPQLATSFPWLNPATVTIAIKPGVLITLLPWENGEIRIDSNQFPSESAAAISPRFDTPLGSILAAVTAAGFHGIRVKIHSYVPPLGGLSASSAALVATLRGLIELGAFKGQERRAKIALLAHRIESNIRTCGLQDVVAPTYGGVNEWKWRFDKPKKQFYRNRLLNSAKLPAFDESICIVYLGSAHDDPSITTQRIERFIDATARSYWVDIIPAVRDFATSVANGDWNAAAKAVNREVDIRHRSGSSPISEDAWKFVYAARSKGCGARHAGRGGGGCLWAIGDPAQIRIVNAEWSELCLNDPASHMLESSASTLGVHVRTADGDYVLSHDSTLAEQGL